MKILRWLGIVVLVLAAIGDKIYAARASRITDASLAPDLIAAARTKYEIEESDEPPTFDDVWLFRMDAPQPDVAAPAP